MTREFGAVMRLVGYALRLSPGLSCPQEIRARMIADMRRAAFSNNAWKGSAFNLLKEMTASICSGS